MVHSPHMCICTCKSEYVEDVQHVNELLRGRITFQEELTADNREKIAQQAEEIHDLRKILRAVGYEA